MKAGAPGRQSGVAVTQAGQGIALNWRNRWRGREPLV
jgi:hypothetical protein